MTSSPSPMLILASTSPRRRELLASLGVDFEVVRPKVDEEAFDLAHLPPAEQVRFLSRTKAQEVFKHHSHALVIGADTIVVAKAHGPEPLNSRNSEIFGKPRDEADAFRMLSALQGTMHEVYSGITVFAPDTPPPLAKEASSKGLERPPMLSESLCTKVFMRALSAEEIHAYIATGEPMDKAGAYAIQGLGATLIERIEGCYFNVVGMSLVLLGRMLDELGAPLLTGSSASRPVSR